MSNSSVAATAKRLAARVGYDPTHITRTVAYRAVETHLDALSGDRLDALEIAAGWKWRQRRWGSYTEMNWPQYDICQHVLDREFDVIIADNVWEHLPHPARAARHVLRMLRPGGTFINITPFLIRRHLVPTDCTRWTEQGMRYFLEDCGFDEASIETGSWGNRAAVRANFTRWARTGWQRRLRNEPDFPVTVWAFARKAE